MTLKSVVVTGAAGGIGASVATALAAEGSALILMDRDKAALERVSTSLGPGVPVCLIAADLQDPRVPAQVADEIATRNWTLLGLVNNAGIIAGSPLEATTDDDWGRIFDINVGAQFRMIRALLPLLSEAEDAAIVNVSSIAGLVGIRDMPAYCASKAAVVGLTRALALDLNEYGIRVNAVCPGSIDTPMPRAYLSGFVGEARTEAEARIVSRHIQKRLGKPAEVADAIAFLLSDRSSFITGLALPVDGGWAAW